MLLEINNIVVHYGKVAAVKEVSLQVGRGEIVTLLGANGAGKTTVLKSISSLKNITSGEIIFDGKRINGLAPSQIVALGIGHVPEGRRLFSSMSVEDNLMLGAYTRKDKDAVLKDVRYIYENFPILEKRSRQRAGSMSGGEQQMLAIGRALMCRPRLLLLDEPSIGLSPVMVDTISSIISIVNKQDISVLIVEQNAALALGLANRGYVLETGRVVLNGTSDELLQNESVKKAYLGG